jgi:hydroxymethylpyrimidine/phosphomethylpyrimidine kinase
MPQCTRVLTIAGSDSSGGAGIQADLKTFTAFKCYGMSVITALTAQNTLGVQAIHAVPSHFVQTQIDSIFADIEVDAIKIGMLSNIEIINIVMQSLRRKQGNLILDPVMVAKGGALLLQTEAIQHLKKLFPLTTLITPNLKEAEILVNAAITKKKQMELAAR